MIDIYAVLNIVQLLLIGTGIVSPLGSTFFFFTGLIITLHLDKTCQVKSILFVKPSIRIFDIFDSNGFTMCTMQHTLDPLFE